MRRITRLATIVLALFAFGAVASASASAHEFEASKTGTATDVQTSVQKFRPEKGGGTVECAKLSSTEKITKTKTKTQKASVKYEECTAFGFPASVSEAKYEFNAEGTVKVENTITIEVPVAGCKVVVTPTGNSKLKTITYVDREPGTGHGKVEVVAKVTGITDEIKGGAGLCGKEGKNKTGEYEGNALVTLPGGELKWK